MADHVRVHRSLLAGCERRLLVWVARRLPRAIGADHLTLLGLASIAMAGLGFALIPRTALGVPLVIGGLGLNWLGDSLDGTVARVRNEQRPRYGFYVDHVVDCAGATILVAGLACSGAMSPLVAAAVLAAFLLVAAESYLAANALGVFRLSFWGVGPTELRILLAIGAFDIADSPWVLMPVIGRVRLFDAGGLAAAAGLLLTFLVSAIGNTRALYAEEPIERRAA